MRRLVFNEDDRVTKWVFERLPYSNDHTPCTALGLESNGQLIAGVVFNSYNGFDINITLAAEHGRIWARPQWICAVFSYVFLQLQCRRCTVHVAFENEASRRVIEGLGFKYEGLLRDALPGDDVVIYGMLKSECRYLPRTH
ncbi:MAG: GNAT family N-acetyltransferase [candidate division KSB1 bacterium]|nr:GNAT family N-acetyltransferase [candidate division KSB1 bacterium]